MSGDPGFGLCKQHKNPVHHKVVALPRQPSVSGEWFCFVFFLKQTRIWFFSNCFLLFLVLNSRLVTSGPAVSAQPTKNRELAKKEKKSRFIQPTVFSLIRLLSQFDELAADNGTVPGHDLKHRWLRLKVNVATCESLTGRSRWRRSSSAAELRPTDVSKLIGWRLVIAIIHFLHQITGSGFIIPDRIKRSLLFGRSCVPARINHQALVHAPLGRRVSNTIRHRVDKEKAVNLWRKPSPSGHVSATTGVCMWINEH